MNITELAERIIDKDQGPLFCFREIGRYWSIAVESAMHVHMGNVSGARGTYAYYASGTTLRHAISMVIYMFSELARVA